MTPKQQYEQAVAHIKAKDYRAARRILERMNHPKASELLAKVNAAIAKQAPEMPDYKQLTRSKPNYTKIGLFALFAVAVLVLAYVGYTRYLSISNQVFADVNAELRIDYLEIACESLYEDSAQCRAEAERIASGFPTQADTCLEQSNSGREEYVLEACLGGYGIGFVIAEPTRPQDGWR